MHIALTTHAFPSYRHGFLEDHVSALVQQGDDVLVVAGAPGDHVARVDDGARGSLRVTVVPGTGATATKLAALGRSLGSLARRNAPEARRLVRETRSRTGLGVSMLKSLYSTAPTLARPLDLLHLAWVDGAAQRLALIAAYDGPVVVSCQGSDIRLNPLLSESYRQGLRDVFGRVDLVHCVSEDLAQHAVSLGADPEAVFVSHWGVDTTFFRPDDAPRSSAEPNDVPPSALRILSVGRPRWMKGYEFALVAASRLRRAGIRIIYTIIGPLEDEDERLQLLAAIRDLGLEDCVELRGPCSRTEVREALRSSDVFLLASVSEGLCTATLEAMAMGVPVVVTDAGGMREAVTDGVEGLVVPSRDPEALAHAVSTLADDVVLRRELGAKGRVRVTTDFDVARRAAAMREQYMRLVRAHADRVP